METNRQLASYIAALSADMQQEVNSLLSVIEQRRRISREAHAQFKADEKLLRQLNERMERQIDVAYLAQSIPDVTNPDTGCAWCWVKLFPDISYPAGQTPGICAEHTNWVCRQVQASKA